METSTDLSGAVLGIDTATPDATVATTRGEEVLCELRAEPAGGGRPQHAAALLGEVEAAVRAAGGWEEISLIALGIGPGMFTGLRVGIATGRALAQARGLSVAPVVSLAALALGIRAEPSRPRLAVIDARRDEVYAGGYDAAGGELLGPFVGAPEAVADGALALAAAPVTAGDGSVRFRQRLEAAGVEVLPDSDPAHRMAARHVCELARTAEAVRIEQVRPIYLRRPDAEMWRER